MVLSAWQCSYNGVTFGAGTSYGISKMDWSQPAIAINSMQRTRQDGLYPGLDLMQKRIITIDFEIPNLGDGNYYSNREAWKAAFVTQSTTPQPLSILINPWSTARRFYCRPRDRHTPEDNISSVANSSWSVQLEADDPLMYSDATTSTGAASSITVPNAGNYPSGEGTTAGIVTLTVSTACTVSGPNGGSIHLTGTGPWTLDLGLHTVSGGNGYSDIVQPATWFTIPAGGAGIAVSAGTVSAVSRDAWDG